MDRGDVDDAAPVGCAHGRQSQAAGMKSTAEVDGKHGVPALGREVFNA